jgi:hypothetical protein
LLGGEVVGLDPWLEHSGKHVKAIVKIHDSDVVPGEDERGQRSRLAHATVSEEE